MRRRAGKRELVGYDLMPGRRRIHPVAPRKPRAKADITFVLHPERDMSYIHFENGSAHPYEPPAPALTRRNAWWLADAALLAYWDSDVALPRFKAAGMNAEFLEAGALQCYLAWTSQFVIVAFRGTEADEWGDVLDDVLFKMEPWDRPDTHVHGGCKAALERVWETLAARLAPLAASRTVWFAGHSLGGALATLAGDRFASTAGICTIGSPRVGDGPFARGFDRRFGARALRYVNDADVVTHLPPPGPIPLPLVFKHVGGLRHIAPDGGISTRPPRIAHFFPDLIGDSLHLMEVMQGVEQGVLRHAPDFLQDHMPRAYTVDIWNDYADHGD